MTLDRAQLSAQFYLDRVRSQVVELLQRQYPGNQSGPTLWLRLLNGVLDTAEDYLNVSRAPATPSAHAGNFAKSAGQLAHFAYKQLDFISGSDIERLPFPVVAPMTRWFGELGLKNSVIFRALHEARYELKPVNKLSFERIRKKSKSLEKAISDITWPLYRVTVPGEALGLLPHFSIVAHEVGHAIFPKVAIDLSKCAGNQADLLDRLATRLSVSPTALPSEVQTKLKDVHSSWLQEIFADAFALFLTGPAIHFASCDFFQLLTSSYGASASHPPNDLRRELTFKRLSTGIESHAKVFEDFTKQPLTAEFNGLLIKAIPKPDDFFAELSTELSDVQMAAVFTELVTYFREVSDEIYNQIEAYIIKNCPALNYTPDKLKSDLAAHADALTHAIPPIETGALDSKKVTEFVSIINVGWVVYLTRLSDLRVKARREAELPEKAEKLHRLLLKAVELSEARRLWEAAT